nr:hypothetical protein [Rubricella aquisinus]
MQDAGIRFDWQVQRENHPRYFEHALRRAPRTKHILFHGRQRHPNALYLSQDALPGFFRLDRHGFAAFSHLAQSRYEPEAAPIQPGLRVALLQRFRAANLSKLAQPPQGALPLPDTSDAIAVMLQVPGDLVLSLTTLSREDILRGVLAARGTRPVIVKPHPAAPPDQALARLHDPAHGVWVTQASLHDIFPRARTVVTGNSGTGLEALLHGCHVITCGMADYGHATTRCDTGGALARALDLPRPAQAALDRYLAWRLGQQALDLSSEDFAERLLSTLHTHGFL